MRIVSFQDNRGVRPGVLLDDNHVLDFRLAAEKRGGAVYRSVLALIQAGRRSRRWRQPGDVVELEIEGIGILRNTISENRSLYC